MNIISGMAAGAFRWMFRALRAGGAETGGAALPLTRTGPVRLVHQLAGRARFRVQDLSQREMDPAAVEKTLSGVEGVKKATVNPLSGSVLVHYDEDRIEPVLLFAAIVRLTGAEEELQKSAEPLVQREFRDICHALNRAVYDRTGGILDLKSALFLFLGGVGMRQIFRNGRMILPSALSLVWWSTRGMLQQGGG